MRTRDGRPALSRGPSARSRWAALLGLALGSQAGCGREFYRDWANQDVSEAVFEKSRDPRWRFDMFSIEPPALARHSNPYDPDRPPAPPDDYATQQLSPVPQWPDNRLLVPAEGTGYLDMLTAWQRQNPYRPPSGANAKAGAGAPGSTTPAQVSPFLPPITVPSGPPLSSGREPDAEPLPAAIPPAEANPGTDGAPMTPTPLPEPAPPPPPPPPAPSPLPSPAEAARAPAPSPGDVRAEPRQRDAGVTIAAFQQTGLPLPVPPPAVGPSVPPDSPPSRDVKPPSIGMDPAPHIEGSDLSAPVNPRPDQSPADYRAGEAMAGLAGNLIPSAIDFDEAEAAGLPRNSTPYVVTMGQAFNLALINSRVYQFQLENVYAASLAVTLQRFAFTPQFYAGLSPLTPVATGGGPSPGGGFALNLPNSFNYATRATGNQTSTLTLGTVAGVGKVFNSGARVLAGFANQLVFNFVGHNSFQPKVQSFLPLSIVQPFLRGGGRAVTLEALTQAERNLVYSIRNFAKFRQEFTVATLTGGSVQNFGSAVPSLGFTGGGNSDPTVGFLNVLEDVQVIENDRRNIAAYEQFIVVYRELIKGESSGLTQLQLDQIESQLLGAKQTLVGDRVLYRSDLDGFKMQMGLPPDTPLIPDRGLTRKFKDTYAAVVRWQRDPRRELKDLPSFALRLPQLEDVVLDGRSVLGVYRDSNNDEDKLEDVLLAGERLAMEHRLDLMNQRATLYDTWRQVKVTANALQGYFNVALTNQFVTPPNNTNPFGFVDQAKQFSVVVNAELPLVRLAERNNFRSSLINYERQRRALMNIEDSIKLNVRNDIRNVQQQYLNYEIAKRNFVLTIRLVDQALEQIIAPPQGAGNANPAGGNQAAVQTNNLINYQGQLLRVENQLVTNWYNFELARLQLYRDLGTLPLDEWEAFHEIFPDEPTGGDIAPAAPPAGAPGPTGASAARLAPEAAGLGRRG